MRSIRQKQLRFLGHTIGERKLENVCATGGIEGKRRRSKLRLKYVDYLERAVRGGLQAMELLQIAFSRTQ